MKKGMIFDLHLKGEKPERCVALNDSQAMSLATGMVYGGFNFERDVPEILIDNIFDL